MVIKKEQWSKEGTMSTKESHVMVHQERIIHVSRCIIYEEMIPHDRSEDMKRKNPQDEYFFFFFLCFFPSLPFFYPLDTRHSHSKIFIYQENKYISMSDILGINSFLITQILIGKIINHSFNKSRVLNRSGRGRFSCLN